MAVHLPIQRYNDVYIKKVLQYKKNQIDIKSILPHYKYNIKMDSSQDESQYQNQRQRYSKLLQLSNKYQICSGRRESYYQNFDQTIQLLKQIQTLSKTEAGRQKIFKIQQRIVSYWLIDPLGVQWVRAGYWQVDNLCLKIICNLATDVKFADDVIRFRDQLVHLASTVYSNQFKTIANQAIKNIDQTKKKLKESYKGGKYKQNFSSPEQVQEQFNKHVDFYNFPSQPFFEQEYDQYIGMLSAALKVGADRQVTRIFPKECFGCVLYAMVMTGYQIKKKDTAVKFLKEYTNGWFTQKLYDLLLQKMKILYRDIRQNEGLTDRHELVCLRFHGSKRTESVFQYLNKMGSKHGRGKLGEARRIQSSDDFEYQIQKQNYKKEINQRIQRIRQKFQDHKPNPNTFLPSKLLSTPQITHINLHLNQYLHLTYTNPNKLLQRIILKYKSSKQADKYKLSQFIYNLRNSIIVIELTNGSLLAGCFISEHKYDDIQGYMVLFDLEKAKVFQGRERGLEFEIVGIQQKKNQKRQKRQKREEEEEDYLQAQKQYQEQFQKQKDQFDRQRQQRRRRRMNRQRFRQQDTYLKSRNLQQKMYQLQNQPIILSDTEQNMQLKQKMQKPSKYEQFQLTEDSENEENKQQYFKKKHKSVLQICFSVNDKIYKLLISLEDKEDGNKQKIEQFNQFMERYYEKEGQKIIRGRKFEVFGFKLENAKVKK